MNKGVVKSWRNGRKDGKTTKESIQQEEGAIGHPRHRSHINVQVRGL